MHDRKSLEHWALARSRFLAGELSTDPYVRSARLLGYTLRSQVRGFFHDPRHPVARALLAHLHAVALEAGDDAGEIIQRIERFWAENDVQVLAGAWKALARDAADAIVDARTHDPTPADVDLDDPDRVAAREAAFATWLATTHPDHSM